MLSRLARQRAALDMEEGRWLLCALRSGVHVHLGLGSFVQYVERLFGYKSRTIQEKLRVAEALEALPQLAGALESGALSWCAARELTRVVVPETEQAWLDAARGKTQRELEALVARLAPGEPPDAPPNEPARRHVLRFEVAADTFATFREATQRLAREAGSSLDDDALLLAMARHVLGGARDAGRSSYQISLDLCARCGRGAQVAAGELVPVDAAIVDMAACDAQHLGERLPDVTTPRAANENAEPRSREVTGESSGDESSSAHRCSNHSHVGAPRTNENTVLPSRAVARDPNGEGCLAHRCSNHSVQGAQDLQEDAAATAAVVAPVDTAPTLHDAATAIEPGITQPGTTAAIAAPALDNPATAAGTATAPTHHDPATATAPVTHAATSTSADVRPRPRARQSIPPALRRAVLARDRHCCVPGCNHSTFLDVHHIQPRSEGGPNTAYNLLGICGAHHRAVHRGELLIERGPDGAITFRHADGSPYGESAALRPIDTFTKVFSALRHLGFREGEVKSVLSELRGDTALVNASVELLLREALCRIKPAAR